MVVVVYLKVREPTMLKQEASSMGKFIPLNLGGLFRRDPV